MGGRCKWAALLWPAVSGWTSAASCLSSSAIKRQNPHILWAGVYVCVCVRCRGLSWNRDHAKWGRREPVMEQLLQLSTASFRFCPLPQQMLNLLCFSRVQAMKILHTEEDYKALWWAWNEIKYSLWNECTFLTLLWEVSWRRFCLSKQ